MSGTGLGLGSLYLLSFFFQGWGGGRCWKEIERLFYELSFRSKVNEPEKNLQFNFLLNFLHFQKVTTRIDLCALKLFQAISNEEINFEGHSVTTLTF